MNYLIFYIDIMDNDFSSIHFVKYLTMTTRNLS